MSEALIVAIVSGLLTLAGTALTVYATARKSDYNLRVSQAITDTKIDELTREVREHNNFARRMPVVEEQIKVVTQRVDAIERTVNKGA